MSLLLTEHRDRLLEQVLQLLGSVDHSHKSRSRDLEKHASHLGSVVLFVSEEDVEEDLSHLLLLGLLECFFPFENLLDAH